MSRNRAQPNTDQPSLNNGPSHTSGEQNPRYCDDSPSTLIP
ncbi:MAG: hypothetical protein JWQ49_1142, partial [Edaphobacter sp.]|nr:hypothetical protein [Edaphobacter sp.]